MALLEFDQIRFAGLMDPNRGSGFTPRGGPPRDTQRSVLIGDLTVEIRSLADARSIVAAWEDLAARAAEPNVFHEPAFLLAAEQHLPEMAGAEVALVWGPRGGAGQRLLALWPIQPARRGRAAALAHGIAMSCASSGAPLLDNNFAVEAASALISGFSELESASSGLLFPAVALDGPAARSLRAATTLNRLATSEIDIRTRACLWPSDISPQPRASGRDNTAPLALAATARGLASLGDVRLTTARAPADAKVAMEAFLALDASGDSARRGMSILSQTRDASFYRVMTRALSRNGQISVDMLEVGDRIAAAALFLHSGRQSWCIKAAHDEALAELAPGVFLGHQIATARMADRQLVLVDSGTGSGAQALDGVWSGRIRVGDLVVALKPSATHAVSRERAHRRMRQAARRFFHHLRGRRD